jgi:hypothetical protein
MMAHRWLRESKRRGQVADTGFAAWLCRKKTHDAQAPGVSKRAEDARELLRVALSERRLENRCAGR